MRNDPGQQAPNGACFFVMGEQNGNVDFCGCGSIACELAFGLPGGTAGKNDNSRICVDKHTCVSRKPDSNCVVALDYLASPVNKGPYQVH